MEQWQTGAGALLADAVKTLAAIKPIDTISVTELCRHAGVTRDTFYRYATSPIEVLAAVLNLQLGDLGRAVGDGSGETNRSRPASVMDAPTRMVLDHVRRNRAIYRKALHPHLDAALRDVLLGRIEALLVEHATAHPDAVPSVLGTRPSAAETHMFAAYAASGAVGAIERWLLDGDLDDIERATELLYIASAPWWFGRP